MTPPPEPDPAETVNPPVAGEAEEARSEVDDMDERVFGGEAEQQRQATERPAASGETSGPDDDPMAGESPSS